MPSALPRLHRGFTLLEVLVAFVILAMVLSVMTRIFSSGNRSVALASGYESALHQAREALVTLGETTPLREGRSEGRIADRYHWRMEVTPYAPETDEFGAGPRPMRLLKVDYRLSWQSPGGTRQIQWTTLRGVAGDALRAAR